MQTALWGLAILLIVVGVAGVVFVFAGIALGAWIDGFARISGWTVAVCGVLAALALVIDYVAATVSAKRAGASKLGLLGAALGTVAGIFTGFIGLVFMPLVGAAIGEWIAQRDALRAGKVGLATWLGLLLGTVIKLAIVFAMVGVFVAALLIA